MRAVTAFSSTRWASYAKRLFNDGPCPTLYCKSTDSCEGRLSIYDAQFNPSSYTGAVWSVSAPTGWSGDRYDKQFIIQPITGALKLSGETGPGGSYDIFWRVDVAGITGAVHGAHYGLQIATNVLGETGPHSTADLVIKVQDHYK